MAMRLGWAVVCALAATLSSCLCSIELGAHSPDAGTAADAACWSPAAGPEAPAGSTVVAQGKLSRQGGSTEGLQAALTRAPTFGEAFLTAFTLGGWIDCLMKAQGSPCAGAQALTLDSAGGFSFSEAEKDTYESFLGLRNYRTYYVAAHAPASGGRAGAWAIESVSLYSEHVSLPALSLWEPAVTADLAGGSFVLKAPTPPQLACMKISRAEAVVLDADGQSIWAAPLAESFDARILEDVNGGAYAAATYTNTVGGPVYQLMLASAQVAVTGTAGAPPSRGAACSVRVSGAPTDYAQGTCPFADGHLGRSVDNGATSITVDLGQARACNLVVVRGPITSALVESSADGTQWTILGKIAGPAALTPAGAPTTRYVRVRAEETDAGPVQMGSVAEISVW